jgi:hypothetical protein
MLTADYKVSDWYSKVSGEVPEDRGVYPVLLVESYVDQLTKSQLILYMDFYFKWHEDRENITDDYLNMLANKIGKLGCNDQPVSLFK